MHTPRITEDFGLLPLNKMFGHSVHLATGVPCSHLLKMSVRADKGEIFAAWPDSSPITWFFLSVVI